MGGRIFSRDRRKPLSGAVLFTVPAAALAAPGSDPDKAAVLAHTMQLLVGFDQEP